MPREYKENVNGVFGLSAGLAIIMGWVLLLNSCNKTPFLGSWGSSEVYKFRNEDGKESRLMREDRRFIDDMYYLEVEGRDLPISNGVMIMEDGSRIEVYEFDRTPRSPGSAYSIVDREGRLLKAE